MSRAVAVIDGKYDDLLVVEVMDARVGIVIKGRAVSKGPGGTASFTGRFAELSGIA